MNTIDFGVFFKSKCGSKIKNKYEVICTQEYQELDYDILSVFSQKKLHKVAIYKERCDGSFDSPKDSNVDSSDDKTDQKEVGGYEAQFNIAVASCFVFQFGFSKCVHSHLKIFSSNQLMLNFELGSY